MLFLKNGRNFHRNFLINSHYLFRNTRMKERSARDLHTPHVAFSRAYFSCAALMLISYAYIINSKTISYLININHNLQKYLQKYLQNIFKNIFKISSKISSKIKHQFKNSSHAHQLCLHHQFKTSESRYIFNWNFLEQEFFFRLELNV